MSPTPRRARRAVLLLVLVAAAAIIAGLVVGPRLSPSGTEQGASAGGGSVAASTPGATPADGETAAAGAAATSSAPFTIKPEPSEVATDAPVERTGGQVDVVLTYAGYDDSTGAVEANGFAAGVIEDGGTCTLTLTKGGDEVTATSTATADATTTSCGLITTSADLAPGTWDAVLRYSSEQAEGTSGSLEVVVR